MCGGGGGIISSIGKAISGAVKSIGNAISSVVKSPIFQMVAPIALNLMFPGLGAAAAGAMGLSAAWAPAIGGALTGGLAGALGGGGIKGALKGAVLGGISSGVADYAMTGNNPLSGIFSGAEGGGLNPLTSAGTGSTQLTGAGSNLGIDKSQLATQFGMTSAANPGDFSAGLSANANPLGQVSPNGLSQVAGQTLTPGADAILAQNAGNAPSLANVNQANAFGSVTPPAGPAPALNAAAKPPGFFESIGKGNFLDAGKALIPSSTAGKVALGVGALSLLGGGGGQQQQGGGPGQQVQPDASFTQKLTPLNFSYNQQQRPNNMQNYGVAFSFYNPRTGKFENSAEQNPNAAEYQFFRPGFTDPNANPNPNTPTAAHGGLVHQYAMGGMVDPTMSMMNPMASMQMASQPMQGMNPMGMSYPYSGMGMDQGYQGYAAGNLVQGMGDGVSDDIQANIGGQQPARLSDGEFVVPSRIVSELGNGSTDAGAMRLRQMMERINQRRLKTRNYAQDSKAYNLMPA